MSVKLKKAFRDLTVDPKKALLVVFALMLGLWGVGSVWVSYVIMVHDLNANYQKTVPAHVVLHSTDFTKLDMAAFRRQPEVEAAERRDFSLHRIEVRPQVWIPLWLYGVEDFTHITLSRIFYEKGRHIPSPGTLLMERDGLQVSDIRLGTQAHVRMGATARQVRISGICFDPGQAPATQDAFIYAYTDKQTYAQLTGKPLNQRLLVRLRNVHSEQELQKGVAQLAANLARLGIGVQSMEIPRFNEHPHQWQLNTLLFLIGAIGFLAFVMGTVLVAQLIRSILAGQTRQIGILKAIGASRADVVQIYLFMLMAMGAVAGIIAIPLAAVTGQAFAAFVASKLNFTILTTQVPLRVYLYLMLVSLWLPVLVSASMVWRGTSIPVREALSDYGVSQQASPSRLRWLMALRLPGSLLLAARNSLRNTRRLTTTMLAMALGVAIFNTGFNVRQSLWELLRGVKNELRYDVQVVCNKPVREETFRTLFSQVKGVQQLEAWVGGRGEIQSQVMGTEQGAGIVAVPVATRLLKLTIASGRWLQTSEETEVVLNQQAWILYHQPAVGKSFSFTLNGTPVWARLVGIAEQFEKPKIYMDIVHYDALANPQHLVNTLNFVAQSQDYASVVRLQKDIETVIASSDLNVLYVMSQAERVRIIYDHLNIILSTLILLSFLVLLVSAVGMASATGITVWERTREIGIMRAIGATPRQIYQLFVSEAMIISSLSILLGLGLAYPLSKLAAIFFGHLMLGEATTLTYAFSSVGLGITIVVTFLFSWIASRIPARSAVQIATHDALSYG